MRMILNFISFSSPNFVTNILRLQDTISNVFDWMSSNVLSLNHSKTEFLLIGLPKQLSKIHNPVIQMSPDVFISPVSAAHNRGVFFDSNQSMSEYISAVSKPVFFTFVISVASAIHLIYILPKLLLQL